MADNFLDEMAGTKTSGDNFLDDMAGTAPKMDTTSPKDESWLTRVGGDLGKRVENIKTSVPKDYAPFRGERAGFRIIGQVAGAANDVIGQTLKSASPYVKTAMEGFDKLEKNYPDMVRGLESTGLMPVMKGLRVASSVPDIINKAASSPYVSEPIKAGAELYGKFKETFPEISKDVEAGANIAGFMPLGKGAQIVGKEGINIAGDMALSTAKTMEKQISNAIRTPYTKAIRPSVEKQGTASLTKKYNVRIDDAIVDIVKNKENLSYLDEAGDVITGKTPQSLAQFAEVAGKGKKATYEKYHAIATNAGEQGAVFDIKPILRELDKKSVDLKYSPQVREYANNLKAELSELHGQPPEVIEARIAEMNSSLGGYYEGRVGKAKTQVDLSVAALMREKLDDSIMEKLGQSGYRDLRNTYGSYAAIEKDVNHRALVHARKANKGLIDFTDIFTGGELAIGIATMNPAVIVKAGVQKGVKEYFKYVTNPDRMIKKMFGDVDYILKRNTEGLKSKTFKNAERALPENPLSPPDVPPVPRGKYFSNPPKLPSTEVKGGRIKGESYGPQKVKLSRQKKLPPGQGYSLSGEPYTPEVIDAIFTAHSRPIESLPPVNADEILQLPYQGFDVTDEIFPNISRTKLKAGQDRYPGLSGLRSYKNKLGR